MLVLQYDVNNNLVVMFLTFATFYNIFCSGKRSNKIMKRGENLTALTAQEENELKDFVKKMALLGLGLSKQMVSHHLCSLLMQLYHS